MAPYLPVAQQETTIFYTVSYMVTPIAPDQASAKIEQVKGLGFRGTCATKREGDQENLELAFWAFWLRVGIPITGTPVDWGMYPG